MPMSKQDMFWVPIEHTPSLSGAPTSAMFDDANGGEYRKSFHAYAPPFAQLVESPTAVSGIAMQIDTWNRQEMKLAGPTKFVSGPVPRASLAPATGPDAIYSGLLECPITTRIEKVFHPGSDDGFNLTHKAQVFACGVTGKPQRCKLAAGAATDCYASAKALHGLENATITYASVSDSSAPTGCSVSVRPGSVGASTGALGGALGGTASTLASVVYNSNNASTACCNAGAASEMVGSISAAVGTNTNAVSLHLNISGRDSAVVITLRGPADVWFGVGLNASLMGDDPYTIVHEGGTGAVHEGGTGAISERKLARHAPGTVLSASITLLSSAVSHGVRTVVMSRPLKGKTEDHYTFDPTALSLNFIAAVGTAAGFGPHGLAPHGASTVHLWPAGSSACVCTVEPAPFGSGSGGLKYRPTGEIVGMGGGRCPVEPRGDLIRQRNPTCDVRYGSTHTRVILHNG
jgi:hypothetical protein